MRPRHLGVAIVGILALTPAPALADGLSGPGYDSASSGIPSGFVIFFLLIVLIGIGLTVYRLNAAQRMAKQAGLDPAQATQVALLDRDGLAATYLASSLRQPPVQAQPAQTPAAPVPTRSVADRLRELDGLRDQGLVTPEEYAERRRAVLESL